MLDSTLAAAVNSLAKQLRTIDKSIRQESKRIESIKESLQQTRLRKEKIEKDIEREIESVITLRLEKFNPINMKRRSAQALVQHTARKTTAASIKFQEAAESLGSSFRGFEERNTEYQKHLDQSILRETLQKSYEIGFEYRENFDQLAQKEEKAVKEKDSFERRENVYNLQTQMLEEQMKHLAQAKNRLIEEEKKVEKELSNIEAEHHDSWNEHIVAADILSLQHSKLELQESIDFLVAQRMLEQSEVAKLKEKLQWSKQQVPIGAGNGNMHKPLAERNRSFNKPSFVTARKMMVEQQASPALSCKSKRKPQKTTSASILKRAKAQTPHSAAGARSCVPNESQQYVDVFGGRKYNH